MFWFFSKYIATLILRISLIISVPEYYHLHTSPLKEVTWNLVATPTLWTIKGAIFADIIKFWIFFKRYFICNLNSSIVRTLQQALAIGRDENLHLAWRQTQSVWNSQLLLLQSVQCVSERFLMVLSFFFVFREVNVSGCISNMCA